MFADKDELRELRKAMEDRKKEKTFINDFGQEVEKDKPKKYLSDIKIFHDAEKERGSIFGKMSLKDYAKEVEILFEVIDDLNEKS